MLSKWVERRLDSLQKISSMLSSLEGMLRFTSAPLDELFGMLAREPEYRELGFVEACGQPGSEIPEVFARSVKKSAGDLALQHADVEILQNFGARLGKTDLDGQLALIALCRNRLGECIREARKEQEKTGKLYQKLGILLGATLIVLLL